MPIVRAVPLAPVEGVFNYLLPDELLAAVHPGTRLKLPFGRSSREGFLVDLAGETRPGLKAITAVLPEEFSLPMELFELTRWVSEYYMAPWGEVLMAAAPSGLETRSRRRKEAEEVPEPAMLSNAPRQAPTLTSEQRVAVDLLSQALDLGTFSAHLLEGVTGSGKTEVYLHAAARALETGGQVLVLVPEIALSPLLEARFAARFPGRVAVLHSRLTPRERREEWFRARTGAADVVLGVRSAVFAPLPRLRLLIVDEEHEPSFKQLEGLLYHARDVAVKRAQGLGGVVVLGSATPSLETRYNAQRGRYAHLRLTRRVDGRALPTVRVVDLRERGERARSKVLSETLLRAMEERLGRDEQIILFLNRRGFSGALHCRSCGERAKCDRCDVSFTLHLQPRELRCHYCNRRTEPWATCPKCGGADIHLAAAGTQRVESELEHLFPGVPLIRMDLDTTRGRNSHRDLLGQFADRKASILLGTQMVAKGHDFPGVTLVGVISAEAQLYLPDFRAGERTFQLLEQVSGRAGRGEVAGEVILQTYAPDHPAVAAVVAHEAERFAALELEERMAFHYPPVQRMIALRMSAPTEEPLQALGLALEARAAAHPQGGRVDLLGPAPSAMGRLRGRYRYQLLLRSPDMGALRDLAQDLARFGAARAPQVRLDLDVDPLETL